MLISYLARWLDRRGRAARLRIALMLAVVAGFAVVNIRGVRAGDARARRVHLPQDCPAGLCRTRRARSSPECPRPARFRRSARSKRASCIVFYAFVGFENATVTAGETREPQRTLPRALLGTIGSVALLYFIVQLAFVAFFPNGLEEGVETPLLALGERLIGPAGALILGLAAVFSLAGNLHSNIAATPRVTYAMAERGELPALAGPKCIASFATPASSILFFAAIVAALAVSGSFVWLAVDQHARPDDRLCRDHLALPRAPQRPARIGASYWPIAVIGVLVCAIVAAQADGTRMADARRTSPRLAFCSTC